MRPSRVAAIPITVAVVMLAGCSSSRHAGPATTTTSSATSTTPSTSAPTTVPVTSTTGAPTTTTTTQPVPAVQILSLTGPRSPVDCNAPTQIQLHWKTRGASKVELRIDADPTFATYPGGARDPLVPLTCDGNAHVYALVATGANGQTATKQIRLEERKLIS